MDVSPRTSKHSVLAKAIGYGSIIGALTSLGIYQLTQPQPIRGQFIARPAKDYESALDKIHQLAGSEATLNNRCQPTLLTHGQRMPKAIGLIHGYTNCPHQFTQFAPLFFEQGYNVYVARLPKHGLADRYSSLQGDITSYELVQVTNQIVDILCGLGENSTLLGFSLGGVLAGWAAQHRPELDHAVLVSPALAVQGVPLGRRQIYANLFTLFPNIFRWWDPARKDSREGPLHAYPRWSTHGIGSMLRIGGLTEAAARQSPPVAKKITVITNPSDEAVDNRGAERLVELWEKQGTQVYRHCFNKEWNLIHDLMDPDQPEQQLDRVYPQLLEWLL